MTNDGKQALAQDLNIRFNRMLNGLLSNVELLTKNEYQYNAVRKKVLRVVNDTLRDVLIDLEKKYSIEVKPETKDEYKVD